MTVRELIEKLSVFPLNMKVGYFNDGYGTEIKNLGTEKVFENNGDFADGEEFIFVR